MTGRPNRVFLQQNLFLGHICKNMFLCVPASFFIPFLDYVLLCLYDLYFSRFWYFQSSQNMLSCIFENFLIYTFDPNLNFFSIMPFETSLKILFKKMFSKLPISYLICYLHHCFFKSHFSKDFSKVILNYF